MISQCPSCKKQIEVPEAAVGKKVRCTGCQAVFVVEANAPPAPKKKTTDAPAAPPKQAPPPVMLDTLEEIVEEPPVKPSKKKKASASDDPDNPFSFEGPSPLAAGGEADLAVSGPAPALDFAPKVTTISAGTRYRARYSAGLMTTAAGFTLVLILGMIGWGGFVFYQKNDPAPLGGACCVSTLLFLFVIVVIVGARSLGRLRSRGLGITAAIFSLLSALGGVAGVGMMVAEMIRDFQRWHPFVAGACCVQIVICLWAALSGGLVTMRAEVIAAIEETRKATAKK